VLGLTDPAQAAELERVGVDAELELLASFWISASTPLVPTRITWPHA
jgi:hypothetical protein